MLEEHMRDSTLTSAQLLEYFSEKYPLGPSQAPPSAIFDFMIVKLRESGLMNTDSLIAYARRFPIMTSTSSDDDLRALADKALQSFMESNV